MFKVKVTEEELLKLKIENLIMVNFFLTLAQIGLAAWALISLYNWVVN
jgi:hypothetical protein